MLFGCLLYYRSESVLSRSEVPVLSSETYLPTSRRLKNQFRRSFAFNIPGADSHLSCGPVVMPRSSDSEEPQQQPSQLSKFLSILTKAFLKGFAKFLVAIAWAEYTGKYPDDPDDRDADMRAKGA